MARQTFVIVGANLTGGAAATTLRADGFEGRVVLIGQELHRPYERPPLSKEYLRGEAKADDTFLQPGSWYEENDVELLLGARATRIDPTEKAVEIQGGDRLSYDRVLVATGGRNRRLEVPGEGLERVFDLRTMEDSDRIRAEASAGRKAVVVGAGFIGCEVAASLRTLGVDVEVVEIFETTLVRALGPEVGGVFEAIHRDQGVRFHFGQSVERFEGAGRVEAVVTTTGPRIECDFAVVGVGIEPAVEVVRGSGVAVDNGILVDELCRTNVEGIYAAGDVANHLHPVFGTRMRVEHWDNALKQGAAAARAMMGSEDPFDDPHWFWSDQYGHNLQSMGHLADRDQLMVRGSLEDRRFLAFYMKEGTVRGVVGLNTGKDVRRSARLIRSRVKADPVSLRDEDADLRALAPARKKGG